MPISPVRFALALCVLSLVGCASGPNPQDPWEQWNRNMYEFNQTVDKVALKPVAKGYRKVVPPPVRGGVTNFFGNFHDITSAVNNLLQFKLGKALSDVGRVVVNSTAGLFGVFDIATPLGLEKHDEDFGQTLGHWGIASGPYVVLPFLGPSTVRDTAGWAGDYFTDPEFYIFEGDALGWAVFGTRIVNLRANLLDAERLLDQAAIDRYAFLRDAYLQRRMSQIHDGNPPPGESADGAPRRKTLKELEEELGVDDDDSAAPDAAPAPGGLDDAQPR
ncbi:MAG: VacJ family lipoprotein [Burkholderiales bacterium]|nr:VacJ family lipoprotein [Burkholderiales bacterium]